MKCSQCGYFNLPNALTCGRCGMDLAHPTAPAQTDLGESLYPRRARDRTWRDQVQMRVRLPALPERAPMPPLRATLRPWLLMTAATLPGGGHFLLGDITRGLGLLAAFVGMLTLALLLFHWWVSDLLLWAALCLVVLSVWDVTHRVFPPAADNPESQYYRQMRLGFLSIGTVAGTLASFYWLAGQWFPLYHMTTEQAAPGLRAGDDVLERRFATPLHSLRRGDIMVARPGDYPVIERVLGLPGDHVNYTTGVLTVNGVRVGGEGLPLSAEALRQTGPFDLTTPPGEVCLWIPTAGYFQGEGTVTVPSAFFGALPAAEVEGKIVAIAGPPWHRRWFP